MQNYLNINYFENLLSNLNSRLLLIINDFLQIPISFVSFLKIGNFELLKKNYQKK